MTIRVLSVASEAVPLIKTGGLADVVGALPAALAPHGVDMTTLIPGYPAVMAAIGKPRRIHGYESLLGQPARLLAAKLDGHPLIVIDAPALYRREGGPYTDPAGAEWPDNWRRFAALGRVAADLAGGAVKGRAYDLVHAHDWQAGMAPAYLRYAPVHGTPHVPSLITVHNMAFAGAFGGSIFPELGLPPWAWAMDGIEFYGRLSFLKAGLASADAITTVSPTYAQEIRRAEFGMGFEGLIEGRADRVHGILNGIDRSQWSPTSDPALAASYTPRKLDRRTTNKRALEEAFGLDHDDGPLFIAVTRLTWQKGMDVLAGLTDFIVGIGGRLALLGSGDAWMESAFNAAALRHPGRIGVRIGYDEDLSHRMQGGGDAILIPSRFEPCGLTQLYGLAYGCVPVVARTGGLADTVIDANPAAVQAGVATGVQFDGVTPATLSGAISRAAALYRQPEVWRTIQKNGMACDFTWGASGKAYAALYARLIEETR
jgi:starch synthase